MNAQILLVTLGKEAQKKVLSEYGFGAWGSSFSVILENQGLLCFDERTEEALDQIETLSEYPVVIVTLLPPSCWNENRLRVLNEYQGVLIVEGPLPVQSLVGSILFEGKKTVGLEQKIFFDNEKYFSPFRLPPTYRAPLYAPLDIQCSKDKQFEKIVRVVIQMAIALSRRHTRGQLSAKDQIALQSSIAEIAGIPVFEPYLQRFSSPVKADIHLAGKEDGTLTEAISWAVSCIVNGDAKTDNFLNTLFTAAYSQADNTLWNGTVKRGGFKKGATYCNSAELLHALSKYIAYRVEQGEVLAIEGSTSDDKMFDQWSSPPLAASVFATESFQALASWEDGTVAIAIDNKRIVTSFPALSCMVHALTAPVWKDHLVDVLIHDSEHFAEEFIDFFVDFCTAKKTPLLRVMPWPKGYSSALTLRHDVDRPVEAEIFYQLLELEKKYDIRASWYWIQGRFDPARAEVLSSKGHENGLHTLSSFRKGDELLSMKTIPPMKGETWHGSGKEYWNSSISIEQAIAAELVYTEFLPAVYKLPSTAYPAMREDGTIHCMSGITGLTFNATVDTQGDMQVVRKSEVMKSAAEMNAHLERGYYLQILNHPDINYTLLKDLLRELDLKTCWRATAFEVAIWWRATHDRKYFDVRCDSPNKFRLLSSIGINDVCFSLGKKLQTSVDISKNTEIFLDFNKL